MNQLWLYDYIKHALSSNPVLQCLLTKLLISLRLNILKIISIFRRTDCAV